MYCVCTMGSVYTMHIPTLILRAPFLSTYFRFKGMYVYVWDLQYKYMSQAIFEIYSTKLKWFWEGISKFPLVTSLRKNHKIPKGIRTIRPIHYCNNKALINLLSESFGVRSLNLHQYLTMVMMATEVGYSRGLHLWYHKKNCVLIAVSFPLSNICVTLELSR